jgi:CheY-like chemotaxis protein
MKKIIMHVEDNEDTRKAVRFALEREGYKVIEAANGEECLIE